MEIETYNSIIRSIKNFKGSSRECRKRIIRQYPELHPSTLGSIIGTEWQYKMMTNHGYVQRMASKLYERYIAAIDAGEEPGVLLKLAVEVDFSPSQLAKLILEQHYKKMSEPGGVTKQTIQKVMKDTSLIEDKDLAFETYLCMLKDDQYGPYSDQIKNMIGREYEMKLQEQVGRVGLLFKTEKDLTAKGYDKTPDIKLETPVAIDGFVVNWIESKALFGSEKQHRQYVKDQYLSYWNRFGPGLVIYWFSYVKKIVDTSEKRFIVRDCFPENLTFLNPDLIRAPTFASLQNND